MQPENQLPNSQPGQPPLNMQDQGFLSIAHTQPMPQADPQVSVGQNVTQATPTVNANIDPTAYGAVGRTQMYNNQMPQIVSYERPASPYVATTAPQQALVATTPYAVPPIAAAGYNEPLRSSRSKLFIVVGLLLCFIAGTAVGLFAPIPGIRSGGRVAVGDGHQTSSLLAPINFQYTVLEDNTSLFLSWGRVEGAASYTVSYAKDQLFTKDVKTKENIKDNSMIFRELEEGEVYYFRVTAHNGNESSGSSGVLIVSLVD